MTKEQQKTCGNCHFCYHHPDGSLICNNPKLSNGPWVTGQNDSCTEYSPSKSLDECIKQATPKLSAAKKEEERCCGACCWFKFEDHEGYGMCEKPHGIAKKLQAVACEQRCSDAPCENYVSIEQAERYVQVLAEHNRWRRDDNVPNSQPMQDPKELGKAIDFAVDFIKTFMEL